MWVLGISEILDNKPYKQKTICKNMTSIETMRPRSADGGDHSEVVRINTEEALDCPFCFIQIETQLLTGIYWNKNNTLQLFLKCKKCTHSFIGYTSHDPSDNIFKITSLSKGNHKTREFQKEIKELSPIFVKIYGESEFAEQENLSEICGGGYRKALEFLVKDYLINKFPDQENEIREKFLGNCIDEMIDNEKIKQISKRAIWLGNDETHYFRKWESKDLQDLKKLIEITVHFISMEIEADQYIGEMD